MMSVDAPLRARNLLLVLLLSAVMLAPAYAGDAVEVEGADQDATSPGQAPDGLREAGQAGDDGSVVLVLAPEDRPIVTVIGVEDGATSEGIGITPDDLAVPTELEEMIAYLAEGYVQPDAELDIEGALAIALCQNHDLNSKRLAAAAACQGVKVQWTQLRPQLGIQAKGFWQETDTSNVPMEIPVPGQDPIVIDFAATNEGEFQQTLALGLTQRIYDFGLTTDLIDIAEATHAIEKYTVDMAEQQLVHDVIAAYYKYNLALGQARIRDDELALASEMHRQTQPW